MESNGIVVLVVEDEFLIGQMIQEALDRSNLLDVDSYRSTWDPL